MEYLSKQERKKRTIKLFLGYGLIAIAVAISTIILVYEARGYDFDTKKGQIIQNGLLFVDNNSGPADIYINGKRERSKTDAKLVLPEGQYNVTLKQDGYYDWSNPVSLSGGNIEYLTYIKLFPTNPTAESISAFSTQPSLIITSPDKQEMYVQDSANNGVVTKIDISNEKNIKTTIALPLILQNRADPILSTTLVKWSKNGKYALLSQQLNSGASRHIWFDAKQPEKSKFIAVAAPAVNFIDFRGSVDDEFYIREAGSNTIKILSAKDDTRGPALGTITGPITSLQDDSLVYFAANKDSATSDDVFVFDPSSQKSYKLTTVAKDATSRYYAKAARFNSKWWLAVASGSDEIVQLFANPLSSLKSQADASTPPATPYAASLKLKIGKNVVVNFSESGRFLATQSEGAMAVYDIDFDRTHRFNLDIKPINGQNGEIIKDVRSWNWFDTAHLTFFKDAQQIVCDFDKTNCVRLATDSQAVWNIITKSSDAVYYIGKNLTGLALKRQSLIVAKK